MVFHGGLKGKGKEREVTYYHPSELAAFTSQPLPRPSGSAAPTSSAEPSPSPPPTVQPRRSQRTATTFSALGAEDSEGEPRPAEGKALQAPPLVSPRRTRSAAHARRGMERKGGKRQGRERDLEEDIADWHDNDNVGDEEAEEAGRRRGEFNSHLSNMSG